MSRRNGTIGSWEFFEYINLARYSAVLSQSFRKPLSIDPRTVHGKKPFRYHKVQETEITWKGAMSSAVAMDRVIAKFSI